MIQFLGELKTFDLLLNIHSEVLDQYEILLYTHCEVCQAAKLGTEQGERLAQVFIKKSV